MDDISRKKRIDFSELNIYGDIQWIKKLYTAFTLLILVGFIIGIIILASHHDWLQVVIMSLSIPLVLVSLVIILKNKFELASIFLAVILFTLITIISTYGLGIHAITNIAFPAILLIASLVIRKRTLVILIVYALACIAWLVFGELFNLYQPTILVRSVPGDFFTVLVILICTAIMVRLLTESLFNSFKAVQKELIERKRVEERLEYDALHDALTNLPNRTLFFDRLEQRIEHVKRHSQDLFAILYLDLDRFKVINDSLGHAVGDKLLVETSRRLKKCLRPEDTVARLSGDEFAILLDDFKEIGDAVHVADRIQLKLASTPMIKGLDRMTTTSIGITVYNDRYTNAQEILRDADSAMYRAKARGGEQYAVFDDTMHASAMTLLQLEADLKHAFEHQEWDVYYQPIVNLPERQISGVEALVRWRHPKRGVIDPIDFIHVAEETGLILPIGEYVLREAGKQVKAWRENKHPGLTLSVNLSGRQFQSQDLVTSIKKILSDVGLPVDALQLEITESVAMMDLSHSARVLNNLDRLGIQISLDDFGKGYSSLGYLNRFPIKILKIDQTFFRDIEENRSSNTIIKAIVSMSHALNLQVVAEGVETEEQAEFLQSISCDKIQGNLICPALPAKKLKSLL